MKNRFGRKLAVGGLALLLNFGNVGGCPRIPETSTTGNESTTGVEGYSTPGDFLNDRHIQEVVSDVRGEGYKLNLCQGLKPENFEGTYLRREGYQIMPRNGAPISNAPLAVIIENQSEDNYADITFLRKDLDETGEISEPRGRTIVRGIGNEATFYSILDVSFEGYNHADFASILELTKNDDGTFQMIEMRLSIKVYSEGVYPMFANFMTLEKSE